MQLNILKVPKGKFCNLICNMQTSMLLINSICVMNIKQRFYNQSIKQKNNNNIYISVAWSYFSCFGLILIDISSQLSQGALQSLHAGRAVTYLTANQVPI